MLVATDPSFDTQFLVVEEPRAPASGGATESYQISRDLDPLTDYYWCVTAVNSAGSLDCTTAYFTFTTGDQPAPFALLGPGNDSGGETDVVWEPLLDWEDSTFADYYELLVATDDLFQNLVVECTLARGSELYVSEYQVPAGTLQPGTTYYWQVTALNTFDPVPATNNDFVFTTGVVPGAFGLLEPVFNEKRVAIAPLFDWEDSASETPAVYRLEIATDRFFADVVFDDAAIAGSQYVFDGAVGISTGQYFDTSTTYYWRVTATNPHGSTPATVQPYGFTTGTGTATDWDGDEIDNTEEEVAGADGFVTDPREWDTDHDDCPDGWEAQWGFDPLDDTDGDADPDLDRFPNWEEYELGTNPWKSNLTGLASGDGCVPGGAPAAVEGLVWALAALLVAGRRRSQARTDGE